MSDRMAVNEAEAEGARGNEAPGIDRTIPANGFANSEVSGSVTVISLTRIMQAIQAAGLDLGNEKDREQIQWTIDQIVTHELFHILGFPIEADAPRPEGNLMHGTTGLGDMLTTCMLQDDIDKAAQEGAARGATRMTPK